MKRLAAVIVVAASLATPSVRAQEVPTASELLTDYGCVGCHSLDGTARVGPSFVGLAERVDAEYLARAIRSPDADLADGYAAASMPDLQLGDTEIAALVHAIQTFEPREPPLRAMWVLVTGCLLFVFGHLGLSFHPVRSWLVGRLTTRWFMHAYSTVVLGGFGLMVYGWTLRDFVELWSPPLVTRWVPLLVMPISFFFLLAGYSTKTPVAAAAKDDPVPRDFAPRGIHTITRHPALWGFAMWGLSHLSTNGDLAALLLFGSIVSLAFAGMVHIDRRQLRRRPDAWATFMSRTSLIPFAAIVGGRVKLDVGGLWWRLLVAVLLYVGMLHLHEWEFATSPYPYF